MPQTVHFEAVERILSALYANGDHLLSSFLFGKPGSHHWDRRLGANIFVRRKDYIQAILFVRQHGAPYLRAISISDLHSMITNFITENFWYISEGELLQRHVCSYAEQTSIEGKAALAAALKMSAMFSPKSELTIFPLLPIRVTTNFESEHFFIINSSELSTTHLPPEMRKSDLSPNQFPPIAYWEGRKRLTTSWLGVRSPLLLVSKKMASAILGAVALTPIPRKRHLFSGRTMYGGLCTFSGGHYSVTGSDVPHTPPLMHDIILSEADHAWLAILGTLFDARDKRSHSQLRALEYFNRAWFLDPRERFPVLCMSLDSLVGAPHGHTSAAVKFVKNLVETPIDEDRLRLLMRVRGAVIHGAAPDVYDSENYEKYYIDYETDPIRDLELIIAKCLREEIFGSYLKYHQDPNAELLADLQAKGKLPRKMDDDCIIAEDF